MDSTKVKHITVLSSLSSRALDGLPTIPGVNFIVSENVESLKENASVEESCGVVFIPPLSTEVLVNAWPLFKKANWVHCFFAGCDSVMPFIRKYELEHDSKFNLTNGRGAFSDSLAEYALTVMLHFNKQIKRIEANRREKVWDKFQMSTLRNKTVGFIGFGHIAQVSSLWFVCLFTYFLPR